MTERAESPSPSTRREFCAQACQAASLVAVAGLVSGACGGGSPTSPSGSNAPALTSVSGSVNGRVVSVNVDAGSPLAAVSSAALITSSIGSFLITRIGDTTFNVFTSVCTHQSCTVSGFASGRFVCPCHGSQFTNGGAVAQGPATRALQQFQAQFVNGVVTFSA